MIVAGRHDKGLTELIFRHPDAAEQYSQKSWKHLAIKLSTSNTEGNAEPLSDQWLPLQAQQFGKGARHSTP